MFFLSKIVFIFALDFETTIVIRRDGRVVDRGGLENR